MFRIFVATGFAAACVISGGWKKWREYYPTILYVIIGDLAYNFVFYRYDLWKYNGFINHTISDLFNAFFLFPSVIILVLHKWPQGWLKASLILLAWSSSLTMLEWISLGTGYFMYDHNWNIFHSFMVYFGALVLIRVHYRHPLVVWPVSLALAVAVLFFFQLPFDAIK